MANGGSILTVGISMIIKLLRMDFQNKNTLGGLFGEVCSIGYFLGLQLRLR